ncbi:predicted protein [Postia placenta Mad-698-R]|uniref:Transmembrane protein n=1 Tax=Postia placenta MAD-698-R-SB12 TaxID=670580 RepID=A0A1X6MYG4_9APHY|nr:hypothetical protein POSPLADRAFT_1143957 [Postia placenta MAD-698-R-SB12]EED83360.1 predicted protein [Postia placenta Mad-698-R]OSX61399.1 hypothetical protein POSPLADRAFT_1143957 [Postia placenta MAD-698-R-SB12]
MPRTFRSIALAALFLAGLTHAVVTVTVTRTLIEQTYTTTTSTVERTALTPTTTVATLTDATTTTETEFDSTTTVIIPTYAVVTAGQSRRRAHGEGQGEGQAVDAGVGFGAGQGEDQGVGQGVGQDAGQVGEGEGEEGYDPTHTPDVTGADGTPDTAQPYPGYAGYPKFKRDQLFYVRTVSVALVEPNLRGLVAGVQLAARDKQLVRRFGAIQHDDALAAQFDREHRTVFLLPLQFCVSRALDGAGEAAQANEHYTWGLGRITLNWNMLPKNGIPRGPGGDGARRFRELPQTNGLATVRSYKEGVHKTGGEVCTTYAKHRQQEYSALISTPTVSSEMDPITAMYSQRRVFRRDILEARLPSARRGSISLMYPHFIRSLTVSCSLKERMHDYSPTSSVDFWDVVCRRSFRRGSHIVVPVTHLLADTAEVAEVMEMADDMAYETSAAEDAPEDRVAVTEAAPHDKGKGIASEGGRTRSIKGKGRAHEEHKRERTGATRAGTTTKWARDLASRHRGFQYEFVKGG